MKFTTLLIIILLGWAATGYFITKDLSHRCRSVGYDEGVISLVYNNKKCRKLVMGQWEYATIDEAIENEREGLK